MSTTIRDIANYAGVSVGTVSKVLNNNPTVSTRLRLRVEAVIERLDYRPSVSARNLRRTRTDFVGLVIPQIRNSFYVQLISSIEAAAGLRNLTLVLTNTAEDFDAEIRALRVFSSLRVAGLMLASTGRMHERELVRELETFRDLLIPVVLVVRALSTHAYDTVVLDNIGGSRLATDHLLRAGHERIGIISSAPHTSASTERIEGYQRALAEHGAAYDPRLVKIGRTSPGSGYRLAQELLSLETRPTAIFIASNGQLLGAIRAVRESQLSIPQDLSIVCFDDTEWSELADPPLTAVVPSADLLADIATRLLFDTPDRNLHAPPRLEIVPTRLVERASVRQI